VLDMTTTTTNRRDWTAQSVREDFPIFKNELDGKPLTYLDSAATSQKPRVVLDKLNDYFTKYCANAHRGVYRIGAEASEEYEGAREKVARFIHARSAKEIVFTAGTTEGVNAVAYAWGMKGGFKKGDEIVTTVMEHHSNTIPWYFLREVCGAVIKFVDVNDDGTLKMEQYEKLITPRTRLVTLTLASNVLGTINPVKEIAAMAHDVGALCFVDAAQGAPHLTIDVQDLDCDFLVFSGHKLLAPTGIGVLYGKQALLEEMPPFQGGGGMIKEVFLESATWGDLPAKHEAGTPKLGEAIALGAAVDYLTALDMKKVREHEIHLLGYALERMRGIKGIRLFGPTNHPRTGVVSFVMDNMHPHDVATLLDKEAAVCVRAGHHCTKPLMKRFGLQATARASFYVYNDEADIDRFVTTLARLRELL
jgi:cysteine desulfurase/selenocysteine lyase